MSGTRRKGDRTLSMGEADRQLAALRRQSDTLPETTLLAHIETAYDPVRRMALTPAHDSRAMQTAIDRLLGFVRRYRDLDLRQMEATLRSGSRLDVLIDRWVIGLTLLASTLLLFGSLMLWSRLFTPVLGLARAVRACGEGDLQARAPLLREDEIGDLCRTFNVMAEAMVGRERERLHFVATVAHDLRNPLVVIGGAAHLLKNKEMRLTPSQRTEWLGNIAKNTHKLERIIDDLMDGVQAQTGQLAFDIKELNLADLARDITQEYAAATQTHLIRYEDDGPCPLHGDRKRLERVVMNLLSNAIKYSASGREVEVRLRKSATDAILTVRDEGAGIAPEDLPRLFVPFSRLENTKKMASGTGLGLSSVKKIIEGHGGTITIQSTLGVGTTVEVRLPLTSPQ